MSEMVSDKRRNGVNESATYPNFEKKHGHEAFFNPADFVAYMRDNGRLDGYEPPDGILLCYQRSLYNYVLKSEGLDGSDRSLWHQGLVTLPSRDHRVGIVYGFGVGAPVAATVLEEFVALGTKRFLSIGTAGSLQRTCPVGHTIVCDRAIRDEGVSHHYLPTTTHALASPSITQALQAELSQMNVEYTVGTSWTIDAPYRETVAEARHYQAEGVLCVEMEAAALFTVAAYRSVEIASAFVVSDSLADLVWNPQFHSELTHQALEDLYQAAATVVEG